MANEVEHIKNNVALTESLVKALKHGKGRVEVLDAKGKPLASISVTKDLANAWERWYENHEDDKKVKATRDAAVDEEIATVGDEVLPVDTEVTVKGGLVGKVFSVSRGYRDRPYYRVFLQSSDGSYGNPDDEKNFSFFYARNLRYFGRLGPREGN